MPAPHSIFVLRFYFQPIRSGRKFRKLEFSLSGLGPDRVRAPDAVAKQDTILPGPLSAEYLTVREFEGIREAGLL